MGCVVITPTVHLNGTSLETLRDQIDTVADRLGVAIEALCDAAPNARDYYPQGDAAYGRARDEHLARVQKLREVYGEIATLSNALSEIEAERDARKAGRP